MNSLYVIAPYKHLGMWVFDDPKVGLVEEPFVGGADEIIDRWTADIPDAESGFTLVFSAVPFPGHTLHLVCRRKDLGGNVYYSPELDLEGWLCPALFCYFVEAPKELFAKAEARKAGE